MSGRSSCRNPSARCSDVVSSPFPKVNEVHVTDLNSPRHSAIYAKALVRKDLSGVVTKDQGGSEGKKSDKKGQKETKDTSGASIGKVVSLMYVCSYSESRPHRPDV